jgi:hypothetical protein
MKKVLMILAIVVVIFSLISCSKTVTSGTTETKASDYKCPYSWNVSNSS